MRKILIIVASCALLLASCQQTQKQRNTQYSELEYNIGTAGEPKSYFLYHEIRGVDYQIFVNEMLAGQSHENNGNPGPYKLNQYVKSSGKQVVKIKIAVNSNRVEITSDLLDEFSKNAGIYLLRNKDFANIQELKKLTFPKIESAVPFYEYQWEFETSVD